MLRASKHDSKLRIICIGVAFLYCTFCLLPNNPIKDLAVAHTPPSCDIASDLEDVLVIVKTGACEDRQKLLTQLQTSLKCVPSRAYFSDLDERLSDVHLRDAFDGAIDAQYLDTADEFKLYKRLKEVGSCEKLNPTDLVSSGTEGNNGNFQSRGWVLDKWKYLPMIEKAWKLHNHARWYIELETDTYMVWPNLVKYLATMDSNQPYYVGSLMNIGSQKFIYGGSGSVLSRATMQSLVDEIHANSTKLQQMTNQEWAGDFVLGKAIQNTGVFPLAAGYEMMRDSVAELPFGAWCRAAISFHHMTPDQATDFWQFQNRWFAKVRSIVKISISGLLTIAEP